MHAFRPLPILALLTALTLPLSAAPRAPRVAVWDPERDGQSSRFAIDKAYHDRIADWLAADGAEVERLTTAEVADPARFDADRYDALMLQGGAFPEANLEAYKRFLDAGGVLVALAAPNGFEIKIAQDPQGVWRHAPEEPRFAWQTEAIHAQVGIQFRHQMDMAHSGVRHTPGDLWRVYLPEASEVTQPLMARWFVPLDEGAIYPLVRSRMVTGVDYTPQMFIARRGACRAIVCADARWTGGPGADPADWPDARRTVAALARLARDLRLGSVDLDRQPTVSPPDEIVPPAPLAFRGLAVGIDPEGARPLVRWGRFDGARFEFGPTLEAGREVQVPLEATADAVPGGIGPGARVEFALPDTVRAAVGCHLRLRAAVEDAGVRVLLAVGDTVLWHEEIVARNLDAEVNLGHNYAGIPLEFTRIVFVPPGALAGGMLTLANTGAGTLHLDALQLEVPAGPARRIELGLHTSTQLAYDQPHALTPEHCSDWSVLRCTTRTWWVGPPEDPKRWERFDRHVERYLALHPRPQFIFEGTPEWAAVNAQRWTEGGRRKHMVPPDNARFAEIAERIVHTYADRVQDWEIWNEANIRHFWAGSHEEFAAFHVTVAPIVRRHDPDARIIVAGMAGVEKRGLDAFALAMSRAGALQPPMADLYGMHCYAPEGMWDAPYGLIEGHLMALGEPIEIYANEQGYYLDKVTPAQQAIFNDRGTARLFASGAAKITNFQSDGPSTSMGIIDERGNPRPAYASFLDYLELAQRGGRRLEVSLTAPDGSALKGVYVAAARHGDGSATLVVNPADADAIVPAEAPDSAFDAAEAGDWSTFWGRTQWKDGTAKVTPDAGRDRCGFFRKTLLDPGRYPELEVVVPEAAGRWTLQLKFGDGDEPMVFSEDGPGVFRAEYASKLKSREPRTVEISFRATAPLTLDGLRFIGAPAGGNDTPQATVRVAFGLPVGGDWKATATAGGQDVAVGLAVHEGGNQHWAEASLGLTGRALVRVVRKGGEGD